MIYIKGVLVATYVALTSSPGSFLGIREPGYSLCCDYSPKTQEQTPLRPQSLSLLFGACLAVCPWCWGRNASPRSLPMLLPLSLFAQSINTTSNEPLTPQQSTRKENEAEGQTDSISVG